MELVNNGAYAGEFDEESTRRDWLEMPTDISIHRLLVSSTRSFVPGRQGLVRISSPVSKK